MPWTATASPSRPTRPRPGRCCAVWPAAPTPSTRGCACAAAETEHVRLAATDVTFRDLAEREIEWYLGEGEWRGRAGGYAVQGRGAALVTAIAGDYTNVVGLPVAALVDALVEAAAPADC